MLREPGDDLELAFRLYQLTQDEKGKELLGEILKHSAKKMDRITKISEMASALATRYSANVFYTEHRRLDEDCRAFQPIDLVSITTPLLILTLIFSVRPTKPVFWSFRRLLMPFVRPFNTTFAVFTTFLGMAKAFFSAICSTAQ